LAAQSHERFSSEVLQDLVQFTSDPRRQPEDFFPPEEDDEWNQMFNLVKIVLEEENSKWRMAPRAGAIPVRALLGRVSVEEVG
jgi:hypothetical protein